MLASLAWLLVRLDFPHAPQVHSDIVPHLYYPSACDMSGDVGY